MAKLFLFDIDGTLVAENRDGIITAAQATDRFESAIKNVTNTYVPRARDFRGFTDYQILAGMLSDAGWDEERIKRAMPELIAALDTFHAKNFRRETLQILPGVVDLLQALRERGQVLGLLTGKLEPIARRVLEAFGLWQFFTVGGFGDDPHVIRADLARLAVERAGFMKRLREVYAIGDTPLDIQAALDAGVIAVGVANGFRVPNELSDAGADLVFKDFTDTAQVIAKLGA